ncbi:MAG TPA: response regulator, partial [Candidatus Sulfopaludibacter sp.]|nr:response regulator [Candidatus Sulfopaludibacter sp.]
ISHNVSVEVNLDPQACFIEADRGQVQQVVMNLMINASEAIGTDPGFIKIRTALTHRTFPSVSEYLHTQVPAGSYVLLEVTDSGIGMAEETQHRIFDPFFTTKFTGRGLGLAAVLGIVKGHKGDITVASRLGAGTTFTILLPLFEHVPVEVEEPRSAAAHGATGYTVLVVDDEEIVLRTAASALGSRGFDVVTASNGLDALELLRREDRISVVVLDLTMPVMTGEQAIPLIRRACPDTPIILSSGYNEAEISRRFSGSGITDVLQKPYSVEALIAKVNQALQTRGKLDRLFRTLARAKERCGEG